MGIPEPSDISTSQLLCVWLREHLGRGQAKNVRFKTKEIWDKPVSLRNEGINKTGTMSMCM